VKKLQAGELEIKEAKAVAAVRNRLEMDGLKTEEANAVVQVSQLLINLNNGMCVKCCKKACLIK
jgi:hypothetical protein